MNKNKIETHSPAAFLHRYMRPDEKMDALQQSDLGRFFIVRVQDMIRVAKLPVPPTKATGHTLIYLTGGQANMTIGSQSYTIYKDECLFVAAGQVFSFSTHDVNEGFLCNFSEDFIVGKFGKNELLREFEFLTVWGNPQLKTDPQTSGFAAHLLQRILVEYSGHALKKLDLIQSYFIALLCELNHAYAPLSGSKQSRAAMLTNRFKELVFENIRTMHRVGGYASLLHVTPNHLNKSVKAVTGKSPTKWIDEAIVLEAKVLLHQTAQSVGEIATALGISDPSYFSRLFKKYEGMTPGSFRKLIETS